MTAYRKFVPIYVFVLIAGIDAVPAYQLCKNARFTGSSQFVRDAKTEESCVTRCLVDTSCVGLNFFSPGNTCFLFNQCGKLQPVVGSVHYQMTRRLCNTVSNKPSKLACPVGAYHLVNNAAGLGTVLYSTIKDKDQCQAVCDALAICTGFDWNAASNGCYMSLDCDRLLLPQPGTVHYEKKQVGSALKCYPNFPDLPPPLSRVRYSETKGRMMKETVAQTMTSSINECRITCDRNGACIGFNYSLISKGCQMVLISQCGSTLLPDATLNYYEKVPSPCAA